MSNSSNKPKVMLHYILPPNISGPNMSMSRIENSWLADHFIFGQLIQDEIPGKILNVRLIIKLIKQIRSFNPDIIHVSGLQSAGFYAVIATRIAGHRNILMAIHGSSVEANNFPQLFKALYRFLIEPISMKMSKKIYTVCHDMSSKFNISKKKNYTGVLHNPAPIINNIPNKTNCREKMDIDSEKVLFCFVGRMTYDKGIPFAIEAIKKINNPNAVFVFVGDGPYYEIVNQKLEKEIVEKKVINYGKRRDVIEILGACDVFVFPTLHENLSNALLEASSVGLAIIATAVGGNVEVIENEVNGILIKPESSAEIVTAVNRLLNNKHKIDLLGKAAKLNMQENFSQRKIYSELMDIYNDLLMN